MYMMLYVHVHMLVDWRQRHGHATSGTLKIYLMPLGPEDPRVKGGYISRA